MENAALASWMRDAVEVLRHRPAKAETYAEGGGNMPHYCAVANNLFDNFADLELAYAGFLHGIRSEHFDVLDTVTGVTPAVRVMLDERNRLRSIAVEGRPELSRDPDGDGAALARHLVDFVLPHVSDARSAFLFVREQLDHVDPTGAFSRWVRSFAREPAPLDVKLATGDDGWRDRHPDVTSRSRFLRFVVSVVAEQAGLWHEAQVAKDAAFLLSRPAEFNRIVSAILEDVADSEGHSARRARIVTELLSSLGQQEVAWEWRNVSDLHERVTQPWEGKQWTKQLDRAGHVAVLCANATTCYEILAALHSRMAYQPDAIRDYIGAPRRSGYEGLHTVLTYSDEAHRKDFQALIPVHILTTAIAMARHAPTSLRDLERARKYFASRAYNVITAFAPDGRAFELPVGASVLTFAARLHCEIVPRLRGATINRRPVEVTHPLRDGDIVWLDVADKRVNLPPDWEQHVPPSARRKVRRAMHRTAGLADSGRAWLRENLSSSINVVPEGDDEFDSILEFALIADRHPTRSVAIALRRVGEFALAQRGHDTSVHGVDAAFSTRLLDSVAKQLRGLASYRELDLPKSFLGRYDAVRKCLSCRPQNTDELSGSIVRRELILHRRDATCDLTGIPVPTVVRRSQNQFFVVETTNRIGVGADVLEVFQRHQVDLFDMAARRMGPGWAVIRLGVDLLGVTRKDAIAGDLLRVPGVLRVSAPGAPRLSVEHILPPRPAAETPLWSRASPFAAGPPVTDDLRFYGMTAAIQKLDGQFDALLEGGAGRLVFVHGPLRFGKTSLVFAFLRRREKDTLNPAFTAYVKPADDESSVVNPVSADKWMMIADTLRNSLRDQATAVGLPPPSPDCSLEECLRAIRRHTHRPIILAIDEMTGVLSESRSEAAVNAIERFTNAATSIPGVLVIWIGPLATLDPRFQKVVRSALLVGVEPLTRDEVGTLVRAEKLGSLYRITCGRNLATEIWRLTRGNPFWVTELAALMYDLTSGGAIAVNFSMETLQRAKERLFGMGRTFIGRSDSRMPMRGDGAPQLQRQILEVLVDEDLTRAQLLTKLATDCPVSRQSFETAISDLRIDGAITQRDDGSRRYAIYAPLLREYLEYVRQEAS